MSNALKIKHELLEKYLRDIRMLSENINISSRKKNSIETKLFWLMLASVSFQGLWFSSTSNTQIPLIQGLNTTELLKTSLLLEMLKFPTSFSICYIIKTYQMYDFFHTCTNNKHCIEKCNQSSFAVASEPSTGVIKRLLTT